jgi:hypothetical protein
MTTPGERSVNVAGEGSQVGVQAGIANIDTVTLSGDVQLTVGQDASPAVKYDVGVENLKSGNPRVARTLIWDAMMSDYVSNKVLFHWLVAMLAGRTVQQFTKEEIDQLNLSQSRYSEDGGDAWADAVLLIYRLLETALPPTAFRAAQSATETDMSLLVKQVDKLGKEQRNLVRPHLELFVSGRLKDEVWQQELQVAQSRQLADDRAGRAWMFFQPIPAPVSLRSPRPETVSTFTRVGLHAWAWIFAVAALCLDWELFRHGAFLGLLGYAAALAGGAVAVATDLESRFLAQQHLRKDSIFLMPAQSPDSAAKRDELADGVDKLFSRYFTRYARDKTENQLWKAATAGIRRHYRDEIIETCRESGALANEVAWLIRYEARHLKQQWQNQTLYEYRRILPPRGTIAVCRTGLAFLVLGGVWAVVVLWTYRLADLTDGIVLLSGYMAWRCWLSVNLERKRYDADSQERDQRQAEIDKEFARWKEKLDNRPEDSQMETWLRYDRAILLGGALEHFHLPRSRLIAHAFHQQSGTASKRARIEGGSWRYAKYRFLVILLAEDGVRQVRANLDFMKGILTVRERTSYRHDAIVSMRVSKEALRQTFELRLTAGEPITVLVRDGDPSDIELDRDDMPTEEAQASIAEEDTLQDVTSLADLLHTLERAAGEGRNWFRERGGWAGAWSDSHGPDIGEAKP